MRPAQRKLWEVIRISPEKWIQNPYGDRGNGFWVVAIIGSTVVWYNDIEHGFNCSTFTKWGIIPDYWCNQDGLEVTVQKLLNQITTGEEQVGKATLHNL